MKAERFGLEEKHLAILDTLLVQPLRAAGCTVSVFGSRARGDYLPFSDLDLLIEGDVSRSRLSALQEQLDDSLLPIRVDMVKMEELADAYRPGVLRDRVVV